MMHVIVITQVGGHPPAHWLVRNDGQWEAWGPGWPSWTRAPRQVDALTDVIRRFTQEDANEYAATLAQSFVRHQISVVAIDALVEFFALAELGDIV